MKPISRVHLHTPESPAYRRYLAGIMAGRLRGQRERNPGEYIGTLVERAVRYRLQKEIKLDSARILSWYDGRAFRYQELDAISRDCDALTIFEIKLTCPHNMERAHGIKQLNRAANILHGRPWRFVRRRLIYISKSPFQVRGIPIVSADDDHEAIGVIFMTPSAVSSSARAHGIALPHGWFDPETRRVDNQCFAINAIQTANSENNTIGNALLRALAQNTSKASHSAIATWYVSQARHSDTGTSSPTPAAADLSKGRRIK